MRALHNFWHHHNCYNDEIITLLIYLMKTFSSQLHFISVNKSVYIYFNSLIDSVSSSLFIDAYFLVFIHNFSNLVFSLG